MGNPLDNPAWSSLNGRHAHLAIGDGPVRRYPAEVSPFAAIESPAALSVLAQRMTEGDTAVLWSPIDLEPPAGIDLLMRFPVLQMEGSGFRPADVAPDLANDSLPLTYADVPEMIDLTALTKPGPFASRTIDMGAYIGLRNGPRLASMAGERMKPDGFTEISAICTHPDFQGHGHARRLTSIMGRRIVADAKIPILNVLPENAPAIGLYESLGFRPRLMMQVHLLRRPGGEASNDAFFSSL